MLCRTRFNAALCLLAVLAGPVAALEANQVVVLTGHFHMLSADVGMIAYDPSNREYIDAAKGRFGAVQPEIEAWLAQLPPEQQQAAKKEWEGVRLALQGSRRQPGLLAGYDLNTAAQQRLHHDALQKLLMDSVGVPFEELGALEQLYLNLARSVSAYVTLTANPFGSMAVSMNDEDMMLVTLVQQIDQLFARVIAENKVPIRADQLRRLQSKWQFIRGTVMKASQQALPYIVRHQGKQIVTDLEQMLTADADADA